MPDISLANNIPTINQILGEDSELLAFCQYAQIDQEIEELLKKCDWQNDLVISQTSQHIHNLIDSISQKLERGELCDDSFLFGIPQGAQFDDLRVESAKMTMTLDFPGYSIGGVANGAEPEEVMYRQVLSQTELLEEHKPRHLLGVGTPKDIVQMVARGIDMFDCVYPTRNARHGTLFVDTGDASYGTIHITNERFRNNFEPINPHSVFPELRNYSKAYLCHLFRTKELLAFRLATLNNLEFYANLMTKIRLKINQDTFDSWWQQYEKIKI